MSEPHEQVPQNAVAPQQAANTPSQGTPMNVDRPLVAPGHAPAPRPPLAVQRVIETRFMEHKARKFIKTMPEPKLGDPDRSDLIRSNTLRIHQRLEEVEEEHRRGLFETEYAYEMKLQDLRMSRSFFYWKIFRHQDLPPEILSLIFRFVVWSSNISTMNARLWITWVCKRWRSIAIADQGIWSAIWFRDRAPYARSFAWFERAGTAPLDLRINEPAPQPGSQEVYKFNEQDMATLMDKLLTKANQIRMLIVTVENWPPALVVLDKLRRAGAIGIQFNMERFELHRVGVPFVWIGAGYSPEAHRHPMALCDGRAPRLSHITVNGIHLDWYNTPFINLHTLDIRRMALEVCPDTRRFHEMLLGCPRLVKLALDGAGPKWDIKEAAKLKPAVLENLATLVLGDFSHGYARYTLTQFHAPNVRDLTLMNLNGEDYSGLLQDMTGRFKHVRLLTVYTVEFDRAPLSILTLMRWLLSMPKVEYFRAAQLSINVFKTMFIDPLPAWVISGAAPLRDGQPRQAPDAATQAIMDGEVERQRMLSQLKVVEYQNQTVDEIIHLLEGRRRMGLPVQKVYINSPWVPKITQAESARLQKYVQLFVAPMGASTPEENAIIADEPLPPMPSLPPQ